MASAETIYSAMDRSGDIHGLRGLAELAEERGSSEEAIELFNRYLSHSDASPDAYSHLGTILARNNDPKAEQTLK
jgi:hypothetical protein